jgi:predicted dithiol-disulfide oxidoreductase (DUF899 family)
MPLLSSTAPGVLPASAGTTYRTDYNSEQEDGEQLPIATIFVRRDSKIRHFWSSELFYAPPDPGQDMRHVDFMWPLWVALDCSPEGRPEDWGPELTY